MRACYFRPSLALRRMASLKLATDRALVVRWDACRAMLVSMMPSTSAVHWTAVSRLSTSLLARDAACSNSDETAAIRITQHAAEQLRRIAGAGEHLRVSVDSGGCSGFEYKLMIDNVINPDDKIIEKDGAKVVVDELSLSFIVGSKLDFVEDLMRSAFRITDNPAATQGCSCGASFTPKSML